MLCEGFVQWLARMGLQAVWRTRPGQRLEDGALDWIPGTQEMSFTVRQLRRLVILVFGCTVLFIGIVMIVSPGPAVVVIPAGVAILAVEFEWARRLLRRARGFFDIRKRARETLGAGTRAGSCPHGSDETAIGPSQ